MYGRRPWLRRRRALKQLEEGVRGVADGRGVGYSREAEEDEECNADNDGEGNPATPDVPVGIGAVAVVVAAEVRWCYWKVVQG